MFALYSSRVNFLRSGEEQLASGKTLARRSFPSNPRRYAPPQARAFLWLVPRDSYKRGNPGLRDQHTAPRCMALTHREPRRSSTSPHAIAATRGNQRTQVNPTTGATARRRGAVVTALCDRKARSPRPSHLWHACPFEERRQSARFWAASHHTSLQARPKPAC